MKKKIVCVNGMEEGLYESLASLGEGYLMVSNYGVDMARRHTDLSGMILDGSESVLWPELGVSMNRNILSGVYTFADSTLSAPAIECDFDFTPSGVSFYFLPDYCKRSNFSELIDAYQVGRISMNQLTSQRIERMPVFNTCPCCKDREKRIIANIENHPISQVLKDLAKKGMEAEFKIMSDHVHMHAKWCPQEICYVDGQINVISDMNILRVKASMIHGMRVFKRSKARQDYSVLRCYNSLGELMVELSAPGLEYEKLWNAMCMADSSNYSCVSEGAFLGD